MGTQTRAASGRFLLGFLIDGGKAINKPPASNYSSQLRELGFSGEIHTYLLEVAKRKIDPYQDIKINKHSPGKTRAISIPSKTLSYSQKKILLELEELEALSYRTNHYRKPTSTNAHAYKKGFSHATAAEAHLGMSWGIKVDIQAFFDHITEDHVKQAFKRVGLSKQAIIYARLCTRLPDINRVALPSKYKRFSRTLKEPLPSAELIKRFQTILTGYPNYAGPYIRNLKKSAQNRKLPVIPPKKIPRLSEFLNDWSKLVKVPKLLDFELSYLFREIRSKFSKETGSRALEDLGRERKKLRGEIFAMFENSEFMAELLNDPRQILYKVRPGQYREFRKLGYLPQGAPTSGLISNIVMKPFDTVIQAFCEINHLTYTRYSDDIVISSKDGVFSRDVALNIISFVQQVCELNGFSLNSSKTRIITPHSRKFILGVLVDGPVLRLSRRDRESILKAIYQLSKFGEYWLDLPPGMHQLNTSHFLPGKRRGSYYNPSHATDPLSCLLGWLSYCKRVDVEFLKKIALGLENMDWRFMNQSHKELLETHIQNLLSK